MTILDAIKKSIETVGLILYISVFLLVFISGCIFALTFSDIKIINVGVASFNNLSEFAKILGGFATVIGVVFAIWTYTHWKEPEHHKANEILIQNVLKNLSESILSLILLQASQKDLEKDKSILLFQKDYGIRADISLKVTTKLTESVILLRMAHTMFENKENEVKLSNAAITIHTNTLNLDRDIQSFYEFESALKYEETSKVTKEQIESLFAETLNCIEDLKDDISNIHK